MKNSVAWKYRYNLETLGSASASAFLTPVIFHPDVVQLSPVPLMKLKLYVSSLPWEQRLPLLAAAGAAVVDGDLLGHEVLEMPDVLAAVAREFGPGTVGAAGVDRRALGAVVFADSVAMARLNALPYATLCIKCQREAEQEGAPSRADVDWSRLLDTSASDADLSITSWQLMFLRSAVNAGFDVPVEHVDSAVGYVTRCYDARHRSFSYAAHDKRFSRAMAGAGALSLLFLLPAVSSALLWPVVLHVLRALRRHYRVA